MAWAPRGSLFLALLGVYHGPNCFLIASLPIGRSWSWSRRPQLSASGQGRTGWRADQPFFHEHRLARLQDFLRLSSSRRPPGHSKLMLFALWLPEAVTGMDCVIWLPLDFFTWTWQWHRISKRTSKEDDICFCDQTKAGNKTRSHDTNWWTKMPKASHVFILKSFNIYRM